MNAIGINSKNPYQTAPEDLKHSELYQDAKNNVFNPYSATYNLQQTKIANFAAFSKITNKA